MTPKPEVVLEFDLADVQFMKMPPTTPPGSTPRNETLVLRDLNWQATLALYVVVDGAKVIPIGIPDGTRVELVVSR